MIVVPHCIMKILDLYLTKYFFLYKKKTDAKRFDHAYVTDTLFIFIYCDSEESYSLPQDAEVIKSSFTVSFFWSRLGQSHNQNSQQFAEAQPTKRPTIDLLSLTWIYSKQQNSAHYKNENTSDFSMKNHLEHRVCHFPLDIFPSLCNN